MAKTFSLFAAALLVLASGCSKDSKDEPQESATAADTTKVADTTETANKVTNTDEAADAENTDEAAELARAKRLADHALGEVDVEHLASLIDDGSCAVFDANTEGTRKKQGLIPTAAALSHYSKYELSELPAAKDTKLVFYCASESCGASHTAAEKAVVAGYDDVSVLPAGVMGWKNAGKPTKAYQN